MLILARHLGRAGGQAVPYGLPHLCCQKPAVGQHPLALQQWRCLHLTKKTRQLQLALL